MQMQPRFQVHCPAAYENRVAVVEKGLQLAPESGHHLTIWVCSDE